jgi:hypothetical protein
MKMRRIITIENTGDDFTYCLQERSEQSQSFFNMWSETWQLLIDNPYYNLIHDLDVDFSELVEVVNNFVCYFYQENGGDYCRNKLTTIEELVCNYDKEYQDLLTFAYKGYVDFINSYLDEHNIQLINTERDEWKTMRFMSHFLGDFKSDKVVFWHERSDNESGEFVQCDLSFVKKCVENRKMPKIPSVEIPIEWEKVAKDWKAKMINT